jgi:hypothetical protein
MTVQGFFVALNPQGEDKYGISLAISAFFGIVHVHEDHWTSNVTSQTRALRHVPFTKSKSLFEPLMVGGSLLRNLL